MERWTPRRWAPPWVRHEHVARYAFASRYVQGKRVIDCACGDGVGSARFLEAGASDVSAFDVSAPAIQEAEACHPSAKLRFQVADALRLPLPEGSADVYVALETLEHIACDGAFLDEAVRVLTPAGCFICSTPNRTVTNPGTSLADPPRNPFHVREYAQEELLELLRARFHQVELYGQNPIREHQMRVLERLGSRFRRVAVALSQLRKLPGLIVDRSSSHVVQDLKEGWVYEYIIAVCCGPRRPRRSANGPDR